MSARSPITCFLQYIPRVEPRPSSLIAFGFSLSAWEVLDESLRRHVQGGKVVKVEKTSFGTKYVIEGPLPTPDGRCPTICAVWFLAENKRAPHFVTTYPVRERP